MRKDAIIKEIDMLRDTRNHLWNATLVTISGTFALAYGSNSPIKIFFICAGVIFAILFFNGYFHKEDEIKKLTKKLEMEEK